MMLLLVAVAGLVALLLLVKWINVLNEYERGVVFRLGRVLPEPKGPGLVLIFWPIDRMVRVSLRTIVMDVAAQDVITRDNVSLKVSAVVYFRIIDPKKSVIAVEDDRFATSQLSQTTLRSVLGQVELDELLAEREKINQRLQEIIDRQSDPWGIKISLVEVKQVDLPPEMQRAIARQAEAEREKRAKIIHAEGEFAAAERLSDAAEVIQREPATLQLRYLQTLTEIATEKNSTIVFPLPIDTLLPFWKVLTERAQKVAASEEETARH
jgi:regulator of protease activity HflC (stomatin/prohibitin superfamily)